MLNFLRPFYVPCALVLQHAIFVSACFLGTSFLFLLFPFPPHVLSMSVNSIQLWRTAVTDQPADRPLPPMLPIYMPLFLAPGGGFPDSIFSLAPKATTEEKKEGGGIR